LKHPVLTSTILLLTCSAAAGAQNGVLVVQKASTGSGQMTNQVQIAKSRMRAEMIDGSGSQRAVIFDGDRQVMLLINPERKSYSEITKADVDRFASQMQDMMAKVPPEMRAKVEAMMKGRGMSAAAPVPTEYRKAGTDKTAKWTCDKYDGYQNGQKTSEICTVDPSVLGLSAADFAVTQQFIEFFEKLMPQAGGQLFGLGQMQSQGFSGFPVKSSSTFGGRTTTSEVTDVSRKTFEESVFAAPAGFQKESFPGMAGRGRQ
jgi:Domain of unknown function (DUF4412)